MTEPATGFLRAEPLSQTTLALGMLRSVLRIGGVAAIGWLIGCSVVPATPERPLAKAQSVSLLAVGDIAFCRRAAPADTAASKTAALALELLAGQAQARVLTLGDNVYELGLPSEFAGCYEPTWGALKSRTWPTPGNHDYGVGHAHGYFDYFGPAAGEDRKGYYLRILDGWAVFSLNSNIDAKFASEQYRWLAQSLDRVGQLCILAAWHHPFFTSAPRRDQPMMRAIFELLVQRKADLVLQGHEHHFERFAPMRADGVTDLETGVRSMVVGTGGAPLSGYRSTAREGSEKQIKEFGVLSLALRPGGAQWQFIDLNRQVRDSGALNCKRR